MGEEHGDVAGLEGGGVGFERGAAVGGWVVS